VTFHEASELPVDHAAFDISDQANLAALLRAEEGHFWHRARNRFIAAKLAALGARPGARILELGCGAGCVAADLARRGYDVTGVDGHRSLIEVAARRAPSARFLCRDLRKDVHELDGQLFDAVGLFDVIEHLEEPAEALARGLAWTRPGGFLVGTVPSLMSLWSPIDEHAGHKIRYSTTALRELLAPIKSARMAEVSPFFRALVPLLFAQRKLLARRELTQATSENLRVPARPVNAALYALLNIDSALAPLADRAHLPGASLWFALRRVV
jgi:2-polyprenyl-3-methyl-5-hydroxy-6-metoxy-1,4-benzoquinol methylase